MHEDLSRKSMSSVQTSSRLIKDIKFLKQCGGKKKQALLYIHGLHDDAAVVAFGCMWS